MIDCIFTIDYEIYGNGSGSLKELVYDPGERLIEVFNKWKVRFVPFVEVAEFDMIEAAGTDQAVQDVRRQIRYFHENGFELGLHLHPQWYNARFEAGRWVLDYREYNLCVLPRERIAWIVDRALAYLRTLLGDPGFVPLSFRAGNWLFQPSREATAVLLDKGIHLDSSVFKGGLQRNHELDYRPALRNGYFWYFQHDANLAEPGGRMLEIPTYSVMVPFYRMLTAKRVGLQRKGATTSQTRGERLNRYLDYLRPWYPLKFDFCRMTLEELTSMIDTVILDDQRNPATYKPVVLIGHTKDLVDLDTVDRFLDYLVRQKGIRIATFEAAIEACRKQAQAPATRPGCGGPDL